MKTFLEYRVRFLKDGTKEVSFCSQPGEGEGGDTPLSVIIAIKKREFPKVPFKQITVTATVDGSASIVLSASGFAREKDRKESIPFRYPSAPIPDKIVIQKSVRPNRDIHMGISPRALVRKKAGIRQMEIANSLGVSQSVFSRWETTGNIPDSPQGRAYSNWLKEQESATPTS